MRKSLVIILLICYSLGVANPLFNQEVADSLIFHLQEKLESKESYYLINSKDSKLDNYVLASLSKANLDIRNEQTLASKSIMYSVKEDITFNSKRSFLFSRQVTQTEYWAEAKVVDNQSSRIEHHINFSKAEESEVNDGEVVLWRSVLISLMTGTLIYSLWSME